MPGRFNAALSFRQQDPLDGERPLQHALPAAYGDQLGVAYDSDKPADPETQVEAHVKGADLHAVQEHVDVGAMT